MNILLSTKSFVPARAPKQLYFTDLNTSASAYQLMPQIHRPGLPSPQSPCSCSCAHRVSNRYVNPQRRTLTHRAERCSAQHWVHSGAGRRSEMVPAFSAAASWLQLWFTWGWEINVLASAHLTQIYVSASQKLRAFKRHLEIPFLEYLSTNFYRNRKFLFSLKLFLFFILRLTISLGKKKCSGNIHSNLKKTPNSSRQNLHLDFFISIYR